MRPESDGALNVVLGPHFPVFPPRLGVAVCLRRRTSQGSGRASNPGVGPGLRARPSPGHRYSRARISQHHVLAAWRPRSAPGPGRPLSCHHGLRSSEAGLRLRGVACSLFSPCGLGICVDHTRVPRRGDNRERGRRARRSPDARPARARWSEAPNKLRQSGRGRAVRVARRREPGAVCSTKRATEHARTGER